jgi:hypothetical protein
MVTKMVTKKKSAAATARRTASKKAAPPSLLLLIATRKGAWFLRGDASRRKWAIEGPHFHGHIVNHMVLDPRDGRTLLAAAKTGHLGPTVFRSTDSGKTWAEAKQPPAFIKKTEGSDPQARVRSRPPEGASAASERPGAAAGRSVDHTFWLTPGLASEPGVWWAGTSPQGLFRSDDGGMTWASASPINDDAQYIEWMGTAQDGTPDGPKMHSIIIDPRDAKHMYFGMSGGGVHESVDGGQTFRTLIDGLDVVEGFPKDNPATHDPHCIRICPSNPDRLYQQNHCGIYRIDRPSTTWQRIGTSMPKKVGDVGFTMVVHPRDDKTAWVLPMDGATVWPRTSPEGKPSVYVTRNAGKTWRRQDDGLPQAQAWWTIKRQAMAGDAHDPVGLYFGTTSGEVWASRDEGDKWQCVARNLPEIYAVEVAAPAR